MGKIYLPVLSLCSGTLNVSSSVEVELVNTS